MEKLTARDKALRARILAWAASQELATASGCGYIGGAMWASARDYADKCPKNHAAQAAAYNVATARIKKRTAEIRANGGRSN